MEGQGQVQKNFLSTLEGLLPCMRYDVILALDEHEEAMKPWASGWEGVRRARRKEPRRSRRGACLPARAKVEFSVALAFWA